MGKQPTGQSNSTLYQIIARTEKAGAQERGNSTKHSGRPTLLANANELCEWVVNLRHEGMPISINMVILRASQLDEQFRQKKCRQSMQL